MDKEKRLSYEISIDRVLRGLGEFPVWTSHEEKYDATCRTVRMGDIVWCFLSYPPSGAQEVPLQCRE
jgi:hypothetical protein